MSDAPAAAPSVRDPLVRTLLVLTFSAGMIDAISFLGLGRVFTANMTGNVVLLGFGVAGAGGLPVIAPIVSLCAFLVGAVIGGALAQRLARHHPVHMARTLAIEVALLLVAAIWCALLDVRDDDQSAYVPIALLALAMGVRNATVRTLAVPDLSTTVVSRTLTALAADSRLAGGSGRGTVRRAAAVLAMGCGALTGALLLKVDLALPLAAAALLALATWLIYVPVARRRSHQFRGSDMTR